MLSIQKLRASVEGQEILKGIDLEVLPGEVHAIMGPNGSGKSTLAHVLAGHPSYEVREGAVVLDKKNVLDMSPDERAQRGLFLAFQYPVEVPGVSVTKFLKHAHDARFKDDEKRRFASVLDFRKYLQKVAAELEVKESLLKRGLNEGFSGGEKKRLEILQMAVLEPSFALLDETDSGLDIDAIKAVSRGVKKIVKKFGTGIVVITHYQRILKYLKPDFVHIMVKGKIVRHGGIELARELEKTGYKEWQDQ